MIDAGELKKGITLEIDGQLYNVLNHQHIKVGRGSAQTRLKLRDIRAGHTIDRSFGANEKFNQVRVERRKVQYLYNDDALYHFMDQESFEQIAISASQIEEAIPYLKEGCAAEILTHEDTALSLEMPITVELEVTETEPGFKGDTASGGGKPATVETGLSLQVPFFVNPNDVIKIDTRTGSYLERV